jgi:hypothetical protein
MRNECRDSHCLAGEIHPEYVISIGLLMLSLTNESRTSS